MDEMFDNPEKFIGEAANKFAANSTNNSQQTATWGEGYTTRVFDLYDAPPQAGERPANQQPAQQISQQQPGVQ